MIFYAYSNQEPRINDIYDRYRRINEVTTL